MIRAFLAGLGYAVASVFILAFCLLVATPVDANPRLHKDCNITMPCIVQAASVQPTSRKEARRIARGQRLEQAMPFGAPLNPPETQRSFLRDVSTPARFVGGRLKCAVNIGVALAERGIRGTGSALAKSYLHWGRPSGPQPGAVAVFNRGRQDGPTDRHFPFAIVNEHQRFQWVCALSS